MSSNKITTKSNWSYTTKCSQNSKYIYSEFYVIWYKIWIYYISRVSSHYKSNERLNTIVPVSEAELFTVISPATLRSNSQNQTTVPEVTVHPLIIDQGVIEASENVNVLDHHPAGRLIPISFFAGI
jgi:hypothetical protein